MSQNTASSLEQSTANLTPEVLNHPAGLFVLFFTEMWERFSYYGMRALLTLFLVASVADGGMGWSREHAGILYAFYTGLVYFTPIIGGFLADRFFGYRNCVMAGAVLMTLGHVSLALNLTPMFFVGLTLLVLGNGLFKPNISSMVGQLYTDNSKKDSAFTIFYMGVNGGAFFGFMLCGFIGETVGWHYGFGLAGVFMLLGMLQFKYAQRIFPDLSDRPKAGTDSAEAQVPEKKPAPFSAVEKDRIWVIAIFSISVIAFFWAFEQQGSSMTIFARDYTDRSLSGLSASLFIWINFLLTLAPLLVISWLLLLLVRRTHAVIPVSNNILMFSFALIWSLILWKIFKEFTAGDSIEVPASWFGSLNAVFIITLAPLISRVWTTRFNPPGPVKFALGLALLGVGFGFMAYGAAGIQAGADAASVSMFWLIAAYFFHTVGELCLSPVGLSYVSKLAPARLVGLMFGVWYLAFFVANLLAGFTASTIDSFNAEHSLSTFFLLFTAIPIGVGLLMLLLTPFIRRKMHGIH